MPVADAIEHHWLPTPVTPLRHDLWKTTLVLGGRSSFNGVASRGMGVDIVKQMSDQTGQLLGGPPRKDLKDEKIFSDESDSMEKLQQMDKDKVKRMEEREEELREKVEKEKHSVEDYESRKEDLQEEAETETVDQCGSALCRFWLSRHAFHCIRTFRILDPCLPSNFTHQTHVASLIRWADSSPQNHLCWVQNRKARDDG